MNDVNNLQQLVQVILAPRFLAQYDNNFVALAAQPFE
jgi:hypothetical protein